MGKIAYRRVAPEWEHPKDEQGRYIPLRDGMLLNAQQKQWDEYKTRWAQGEVHQLMGVGPDGREIYDWAPKEAHELDMSLEHYYGDRPSIVDYGPAWPSGYATAWQVYEEVTEGTPISKVFPDLDTMAREIAQTHGHTYEAMRKKILATLQHGWWYEEVKHFEKYGKYSSMTFAEV
jgi:hypothetical protein